MVGFVFANPAFWILETYVFQVSKHRKTWSNEMVQYHSEGSVTLSRLQGGEGASEMKNVPQIFQISGIDCSGT